MLDKCCIKNELMYTCEGLKKRLNYAERDLLAKKVFSGEAFFCSECGETVRFEKRNTDMNDDWKDLEIGDIPSDFFRNKNYEIRNRWKEGEWLESDYSGIGSRSEIIANMEHDDRFHYQYRLKPLESNKISIELAEAILEHQIPGATFDHGQIIRFRGRKVELQD